MDLSSSGVCYGAHLLIAISSTVSLRYGPVSCPSRTWRVQPANWLALWIFAKILIEIHQIRFRQNVHDQFSYSRGRDLFVIRNWFKATCFVKLHCSGVAWSNMEVKAFVIPLPCCNFFAYFHEALCNSTPTSWWGHRNVAQVREHFHFASCCGGGRERQVWKVRR